MKNKSASFKSYVAIHWLILAFLLKVLFVQAVDLTWSASSGSNPTDWNTKQNWSGVSGGQVPTINDNVIIPSGISNYPTLSANGACLSLTINGGSVNVSTFTLTVAGDVTIESGTMLSVTLGSVEVAGNWTNNEGTFTAGTGTVKFTANTAVTQTITGNSTFYDISKSNSNSTLSFGSGTTTIAHDLNIAKGTMDGDASTVIFTGAGGSLQGARVKDFYNLQINSGAVLTQTASSNIYVNNLFTNNGTLSLHSDANLLAQSITGNGTTNVFVEFGNDDWYLASSPVSGLNMKAFGETNEIGEYQDTYDIGIHSESAGKWSYPVPTSDTYTESFDFGTGYGIRLPESSENADVEFSGNLFSDTELSSGVSVTAGKFGWNCLGNPLPAAMDVSAFLTNSTNDGIISVSGFEGIYTWNNATDQYVSQATGDISKCQGFFIKAESGGSIQFTRSMQSNSSVSLKSGEYEWPKITLEAKTSDYIDKTWIQFNVNMTAGLDKYFDRGKFKGNSNISLYQELLEGVGPDMETQALPEPVIEAYRIPIGLDLAQGADITFSVQCDSLPENIIVMLEDAQTNIQTQLNIENANYTVTLGDDTHGFGRFYLLVSKSEVTDLDDICLPAIHVFTQERTIFVRGEVAPGAEIDLYNINGKLLLKKILTQTGQNKIDASGLPAGVYLLNVRSNGTGQTYKTVLK